MVFGDRRPLLCSPFHSKLSPYHRSREGCDPPQDGERDQNFPRKRMNIHFGVKSPIRTPRQVVLRPALQRVLFYSREAEP